MHSDLLTSKFIYTFLSLFFKQNINLILRIDKQKVIK